MAIEKEQGSVSIDAQNIMPVIKRWLYSDKDIFLREAGSNACDAITKYRMLNPGTEEEMRVISLNIYGTNGIVTMDVMNYFNGDLEFRNGLPVTNKADKDYHGFGMLSIRKLVEKYEGAMEIRMDDGVFTLCISFFR